jgi:uncharacterized membrane protein YgdD (TMEM256/DUF423 family)
MSARLTLFASALVLFAAVAAGAFGAHTLANKIATEGIAVWQSAVQYQAWHGLALFGVGLLMRDSPGRRGLIAAAWLFLAGILMFSGSLYALALTGTKSFGLVTPLGGIAFLAGWATLAATVWRR